MTLINAGLVYLPKEKKAFVFGGRMFNDGGLDRITDVAIIDLNQTIVSKDLNSPAISAAPFKLPYRSYRQPILVTDHGNGVYETRIYSPGDDDGSNRAVWLIPDLLDSKAAAQHAFTAPKIYFPSWSTVATPQDTENPAAYFYGNASTNGNITSEYGGDTLWKFGTERFSMFLHDSHLFLVGGLVEPGSSSDANKILNIVRVAAVSGDTKLKFTYVTEYTPSASVSTGAIVGIGVGSIVGIVVGSIAALLVVIGLIYWFRRRSNDLATKKLALDSRRRSIDEESEHMVIEVARPGQNISMPPSPAAFEPKKPLMSTMAEQNRMHAQAPGEQLQSDQPILAADIPAHGMGAGLPQQYEVSPQQYLHHSEAVDEILATDDWTPAPTRTFQKPRRPLPLGHQRKKALLSPGLIHLPKENKTFVLGGRIRLDATTTEYINDVAIIDLNQIVASNDVSAQAVSVAPFKLPEASYRHSTFVLENGKGSYDAWIFAPGNTSEVWRIPDLLSRTATIAPQVVKEKVFAFFSAYTSASDPRNSASYFFGNTTANGMEISPNGNDTLWRFDKQGLNRVPFNSQMRPPGRGWSSYPQEFTGDHHPTMSTTGPILATHPPHIPLVQNQYAPAPYHVQGIRTSAALPGPDVASARE
ncbi:hypothetical protein GGF32_006971 [Allomyces javanicus]|nr:hypothetical protein GGF32_006971 [Allomyces javanicus]